MSAVSPLVSVVIPTYNRRSYIGASVESVLGQNFDDFEVIVVDDGSTDGTEEVLRPYAGRIRYVRQENRGAAVARNRGIRESRAEYIAFMDSDDLASPTHLRSLHGFLGPRADFGMAVGNGAYLEGRFHGRSTIIPSDKATKLERRGLTFKDVFGGRIVRLQGTLSRRRALEEVGLLDERFRLSYDLDLVLRLLQKGKVGFVNDVVYLYRKHGDNLSADDELRSRENLLALDKLKADCQRAIEDIGKGRFIRLYAHRHYRLAKALAAKGDVTGARRAIGEAITFRPLSLKYRLWRLQWL
jgi:glycosyltransferase involved in cell wall biosynthesis